MRPVIVCLCGSTRFAHIFHEENMRETLKGRIVLSIGVNVSMVPVDEETKDMLDELHLRKIDLADEILVLNVGGYIGNSTRREIEHAMKRGKGVRYYEPLQPNP